ncbi:MAG: response regulator [Xanthobacteraceae bacterium]
MSAKTARACNILVVEDEAMLREMIVEELADAGFKVLEAESGEAALALLDGGSSIEVLFTDIRLAGLLDGWELARRARAVIPELHVIYASGYTVDRTGQVPDSTYIKKPYLPSAIIDEINRRLSGAVGEASAARGQK